MISVGWAALLSWAWVQGEVTAVSLLACGFVPGALYWTIASFLDLLTATDPALARQEQQK